MTQRYNFRVNPSRPRLINLSAIHHESGDITVIEEGSHSPFAFRRVYYLHGLNPESERGSHAHHQLRQLMIAITGSFRVRLTGSGWEESYFLNDPNVALYVPPRTWRDLDQFSDEAICLVLASEVYEEADYIRDYQEFRNISELPS